ncbi:MAG: DUF6057 family protein [Bacteroidales bacterium]|nr:DUF6057 family protein [Bacteroidales bacterium]
MKFLPAVFAVIVFVCYGVVHPEWFNYHEQYQLFMFGWDYLSAHLSVASGMSGYLAEMLVQFYFFPYLGAAIWAGILVLMGWLVWRVASRMLGAGAFTLPLSLLPSLLMALYCGDQNVMMAFPVSIILSLAFLLVYSRIGDNKRLYCQALLLPLVYWIAGYGVLIYSALAIVLYSRKEGVCAGKVAIVAALHVAVVALIIVLAGYTVMKQYPFSDIIYGVDFYRDRLVVPIMQHVVAASVVLVPIVAGALTRAGKWFAIASAVVISVALPLLMPTTHDRDTYSLLKIDYWVRFQEWNNVISYSEAHPPINDMACTGLNLALAMTGQLPERMFEFPQYGNNGLLSRFARDMVSCGITAEACYYLGMVNSVLRYNYDSQAAIVNCNKSGRFTRRIAEAYMLCGNYEPALKYIEMLKKTIFYAPWANKAEACCLNPEKIKENKRWNTLMRYRLPEGQLYSVSDMDMMLMNVYKHCDDNLMALQYALACALLDGKLKNFVDYASNLNLESAGRAPKSYQEALAWIYLRNKGTLDGMPGFISGDIKAALAEFDRLCIMDPNSPKLRQAPLAGTYWHYIMFR